MGTTNPYAAPKARVADLDRLDAEEWERLRRVASGQRLLIYALLASLGSLALQMRFGSSAWGVGVAASVLAIFGAVRLAGGLGRGWISRTIYAIVMLVPFLNMIIMATLSSQGTQALRKAGVRVGLLGARAADLDRQTRS